MKEERTEWTQYSFPQSHNQRSCTTEGVQHVIKRKRTRRVRRAEDRSKAWPRVAEVLSKMVRPTESPLHKAKEMVEATTSATVQAQRTLKGGMNGIRCPINHVVHIKSEPSDEELVDVVHIESEPSDEELVDVVHIKSEPSDEELVDEVHIKSEPSDEELVNFRGLAMLPRYHASLLVRACIDHPDMAICPESSLRWREFAYCTLGELLFLLTSTRRREMTQKACEHLRILWKEAQGLGFDLSWLAPSVESGLHSISELKDIRPLEVRKEGLKEHRDTLHCQLTTLATQLTDVEKRLAALEGLKERRNTLHCQLTTITMQLIEVEKGLATWENLFQCAKKEHNRFIYPYL